MSTTGQPGKTKRGVKTALILGGIWLALLAGLWYLTRAGAQGEIEGNNLLIFLGRFHALVVHVPIGLIILVPVLEILARRKAWANLKDSVPLVLWLTLIGALASSLFGYLLMQGEQVESRLMTLHLWTGLGVGFFAVVTLVFKLTGHGALYAISLTASVALVGSAGHFGGALVHGKGYLAAHAPEFLKPVLMAGLEEMSVEIEGEAAAVADAEPARQEVPFDDRVIFTDFVLPVLDAKCNECHNEEKTKGKLRLDTHELILAGVDGADYPNVAPGDSDESEMIYRVTIESDDDDFMPPDGKKPLAPEEIKLLRWWIDGGASAEMTVAEADADDDMVDILLAIEAILAGNEDAAALAGVGPISEWDLLSPEERIGRLDAGMALAAQYNFSLMPISAEDDRLRINVVNAAKEFGDEQLAALEPIAERVVWLDLARSQVTDAGMKTVGRMRNLERIHLENTGVTDAGIAELSRLSKVQYLNLYGTPVTEAIFDSLDGMGDLNKLYLWQTKVNPVAAKAFQRSMSLEVNTGYELAAAKPAAVEDAKDVTPPEKEPTNQKPESPVKTPEPEKTKQAAKKPPAKPKPGPAGEVSPGPQPDKAAQPAESKAKQPDKKTKPAGS